MGSTKKKTTTAAPAKPSTPAAPATDSGKPISTFKVGDTVMIGSDMYVITSKGKTIVCATLQHTDHNNNTYGISRDEIPGTTKAKSAK